MSHAMAQIICSTNDTEFVYPYAKSTNKLMFQTTAQMQLIITTAMLTSFLSSIECTSVKPANKSQVI